PAAVLQHAGDPRRSRCAARCRLHLARGRTLAGARHRRPPSHGTRCGVSRGDRAGPPATAPDTIVAAAPRFLIEIVAWVATPWALAPHSIVLAVLADVLLIGLPTVDGRRRRRGAVACP